MGDATNALSVISSEKIALNLKQKAVDEHLMESALLDCYGRFITLLPDNLLKDHVHLYFQIQEAHWWYEDHWRENYPTKLPKLNLKDFGLLISYDCPILKKYIHPSENSKILQNWIRYCRTIPLRGAILLNENLTKCILVQGWKGGSWMYPRGKMDEMEEDSMCASREIWEELGVDVSSQIDEQMYIEVLCDEQSIKLFVLAGIPESTVFTPQKRKEIGNIRWVQLEELPGWGSISTSSTMYYQVAPFTNCLRNWIELFKKPSRSVDELGTSRGVSTGRLKYQIPQGVMAEALKRCQTGESANDKVLEVANTLSKNAKVLEERKGINGVRRTFLGQRSFDDQDVEKPWLLGDRVEVPGGRQRWSNSAGKKKRFSTLTAGTNGGLEKCSGRNRDRRAYGGSLDDTGVRYQQLNNWQHGRTTTDRLNSITFEGSAGGWSAEEMFKVNATKFGILSTYSIDAYTVPLPSKLKSGGPKNQEEKGLGQGRSGAGKKSSVLNDGKNMEANTKDGRGKAERSSVTHGGPSNDVEGNEKVGTMESSDEKVNRKTKEAGQMLLGILKSGSGSTDFIDKTYKEKGGDSGGVEEKGDFDFSAFARRVQEQKERKVG